MNLSQLCCCEINFSLKNFYILYFKKGYTDINVTSLSSD